KENPNVDLISFFILRTPEDMSSTPQNELSLIPFPTDELFTRELKGFDLIILQNFNYRPYVRREYLDNVARYVSDGGALVMIGGDLSFGAGGYADTEIEDVLPVRIWGAESPFILGEFAASLTPSGAHHPIMRLDPRDGANRAEWNALPTLLGVNRVHDVRSGATVLAWGPPDGRGGRAPLIVAGEAGRGRVMAVTTDTTWRWSFLNAERQGTGDAYHRFWDNAIRWLVKDPEFGRVRITPRRARFDPGAPIEAGVDVLNVEYAPAPEAPLDLRIEDARKGGALLETRAMTDESGHFDVTWTPPGVGFYRIVAVSGPERAEAIVEAEGEASSLLERRRTTLGHDLLAALARESGGAFATVRRDRDFIRADIPPGGRVHVLGRDLVPLWSSGWMIALFVGLAGADWALRKRWGLP
ncbi:MAG: hypothetical protein KC466_03560, partial [Myxococcales bacterium]|nr:hypothetical protein [Myxococcales bacterium]